MNINLYDISFDNFVPGRHAARIGWFENDRHLAIAIHYVKICQDHVIFEQRARPKSVVCAYQYYRGRIVSEQDNILRTPSMGYSVLKLHSQQFGIAQVGVCRTS